MSNEIIIEISYYRDGTQIITLTHDNSQTDASIATLDVIKKLVFLLNIGSNKSFDADVIDEIVKRLCELKND